MAAEIKVKALPKDLEAFLLRVAPEEQLKKVSGKKRGTGSNTAGVHRGYNLSKQYPDDRIDVLGTIRQAASKQKQRDGDLALNVKPQDLCYERRIPRVTAGVLFVVDTSRSQGAEERLSYAKGAILTLLSQVYYKRFLAGMVTFGDKKADLVLPLTKSVERADRLLQDIPAKGNTPLADGLRKGMSVLQQAQENRQNFYPVMIVLTDGKGNWDSQCDDPLEGLKTVAAEVADSGIQTLVVDTENSIFSLGMAKDLASWMNADYTVL